MNKRNWVWCWVCMFLVVFTSQAFAQKLPPTAIKWFAINSPGISGTYGDVAFAGIPGSPGEYDVSNAMDLNANPVYPVYPAWCITNVHGIDTGTPVNLYSTRFPDFLPEGLQKYQVVTYDTDVSGIPDLESPVHSVGDRVPWNELNWLLNNRGGHSVTEMEYAIRRLMYGEDEAEIGGKGEVGEGKGLDLYSEALHHRWFIPGPGQIVAVMLYREGDTVLPFSSQIEGKQDVIIELPVPKPIHLKCASCIGDAAKLGVEYSETMIVTGGVAPYTFSIVGGSLPDGLELNSDGEISGFPTKAGFFVVKIKVEDFQGNSDTAICLIIVTKPYIRLDCGDCYSKTGYVGTAFSHQLYVAGGVAPFTFSVLSGSLPPGLALVNGVITGTPTAAGTYNFTVMVVDSKGTSDTDSCSIVIRGPSIVLSCTSCGSTAKVGVDYSQQLKVSGGTPDFTFSIVSGSLPPGLQLGSASGKITGKPTTAGTYGFKAKVVDSKGSYDTVWCSIEVRRCW